MLTTLAAGRLLGVEECIKFYINLGCGGSSKDRNGKVVCEEMELPVLHSDREPVI